MAPTDKKLGTSEELIAINSSVASIATSVRHISEEQLPSLAHDTKEARDGVIRLTVAHEELTRRVDVVETAEEKPHTCFQKSRIAELASKWKWAVGLVIPLALAVGGAYVAMNRLDASLEVRVDHHEKTLQRHEESFGQINKTLQEEVVPSLKNLPVRPTKVVVVPDPDPDLTDIAARLSEPEQREFLRLIRKAKNGDR